MVAEASGSPALVVGDPLFWLTHGDGLGYGFGSDGVGDGTRGDRYSTVRFANGGGYGYGSGRGGDGDGFGDGWGDGRGDADADEEDDYGAYARRSFPGIVTPNDVLSFAAVTYSGVHRGT